MKGYYNLENKGISVPFHWGREVLIITILTLALLLGISLWFLLMKLPNEILWLFYLLSVSLPFSAILCFAFAPLRLSVDDRKVTLKKGFGSLEIPLTKIRSVTEISKKELRGSIRTFGSGGLFGYWGRFWNRKLGHYVMYATEWNPLILIRTYDKKYVFSCRRSKEFIELIMKNKK